MRVITNYKPRDIVQDYELTEKERAEFDYLDWDAIDAGKDSALFVRYKGDLISLGDFSADWGVSRDSGLPESLRHWDGFAADSAFSGLAVRWVRDEIDRIDPDQVVLALVLC